MTKKKLGVEPWIDPTANVRDSTLGAWTAVGARTSISESTLGDYSYVVSDSNIIYSQIGRFCSIAAHTRLNPGNHPLAKAALHHFSYRTVSYDLGEEDDAEFFEWRRRKQVRLGDDVWIGHGAVVLPGVTIGTGAAVGASAVVSRDVPPFAVVSGFPARLLYWRFDEKVREGLLRIAWWSWPREQLRAAMADFRKLSAEEFVEKYDSLKIQTSPTPENDPTGNGHPPE
jgi:phosphonate metabolism protein (transferase hexapeptide repeat family)